MKCQENTNQKAKKNLFFFNGERQRKTYTCIEDEMLEASIKMSLFLKTHNLLKVRMIYVRIDAEQTFEYCFHNFSEVWRERRT